MNSLPRLYFIVASVCMLSERLTFEQRAERNEGVRPVNIWWENILYSIDTTQRPSGRDELGRAERQGLCDGQVVGKGNKAERESRWHWRGVVRVRWSVAS